MRAWVRSLSLTIKPRDEGFRVLREPFAFLPGGYSA
jgi:hypothetical protein